MSAASADPAGHTVVFDGSLPGLLSVVFDVFAVGLAVGRLERAARHQPGMFATPVTVATDEAKAQRVWRGIERLRGQEGFDPELVLRCWLFDTTESDTDIAHLLARVFREGPQAAEDYRDESVYRCRQVHKKMFREIHRTHAFVRFAESADGLYLARIAPDFDVLPLAVEHFERRYQDQEWMIWDEARGYGYWYTPGQTRAVRVDPPRDEVAELAASAEMPLLGQAASAKTEDAPFAAREDGFRDLWATYYRSVNIEARRNPKLHRQHVPKRYWRRLIELGGA